MQNINTITVFKNIFSGFGFLLTLFFLIAPCSGEGLAKENGTLRSFKTGDQMPTFTLPLLENQTEQSFSASQDVPSVVMFFSARPDFRKKRSLAMLDSLADLANQYKNQINVVGVFSDDKESKSVIEFIKKSSIKLKVFNDKEKLVYNKYGVFMMPLVILIDSSGKLHEVIPYTFNVREIVEGNIKLLLGEWNKDQLMESLKPKEKLVKSEEEKEYIRRINYGRIMQSKKMYSQAIREYSTAVKLMPENVQAYIELGFSYIAVEKFDEAEGTFKNALQLDKESDDAIAGLGLSYYGKGDHKKALVELQNAFIVPEPRLEVIIAMAEIYEKQGDNNKANRLNKLAVSKLMELYQQRWK